MRLSEKYRPQSLSEIVGQPPTTQLARLAANPVESCWLLEGPPGVGKTSTALAFAASLDCSEWGGLFIEKASDLSIDRCRHLFESALRLRPMTGGRWKVLVIEEFEYVVSDSVRRYLKVALETLPRYTIVFATSNDASKIEKALRQRFNTLFYQGGQAFAVSCQDRLAAIWHSEYGDEPLPFGWTEWGWDDNEFSMRVALNRMDNYAMLFKIGATA